MYDSCSKCYIFHWRNRQQFFHGDKSLRTCKKKSRVEELLNGIYTDYNLTSGEETMIGDDLGVYYIGEPKGDTISTLAILNYTEEVMQYGYPDNRLKLTTKHTKLYATTTSSSLPIRVYKIQKRVR